MARIDFLTIVRTRKSFVALFENTRKSQITEVLHVFAVDGHVIQKTEHNYCLTDKTTRDVRIRSDCFIIGSGASNRSWRSGGRFQHSEMDAVAIWCEMKS